MIHLNIYSLVQEDSGQDHGGDGLVGGNTLDDNNLCVADLVLASLPGGSSVACNTKHLSDKSFQAHYAESQISNPNSFHETKKYFVQLGCSYIRNPHAWTKSIKKINVIW